MSDSGFFITLLIGVFLVIGVTMMPGILVKNNRRNKTNAIANPENPGAALADAGMADGMVAADRAQTKQPNPVS